MYFCEIGMKPISTPQIATYETLAHKHSMPELEANKLDQLRKIPPDLKTRVSFESGEQRQGVKTLSNIFSLDCSTHFKRLPSALHISSLRLV